MKDTYQIDPAHSSVQFSVRHMMISNVRGSFSGIKGTVVYDSDNPSGSTIEAEIDAASINSHDAQRDEHLRGPEFLDTARYPTITFKSTKVERAGEGELKVTGDVTIHGVTKPVTLTVEDISSDAKDPWGKTRAAASAKTKLNRKDFGLSWNVALEAGGVLVGDEIKLEFEIEAVKAQSAAA